MGSVSQTHSRFLKGLGSGLSLALRRLEWDLRDEWFPDPLQYRDVLSESRVRRLLEMHPRLFEGCEAEQFTIPKQGFLLRSSSETCIIDRLAYQMIVDQFAEQCDAQMSSRVYSLRLTSKHSNKRLFRPPVEQWKKFIRDVGSAASSRGKFLLITDLHNYFEWIYCSRLSDILRRLRAAGTAIPLGVVSSLEHLLRRWSPTGGRGMPQNQDPSSFLANLYLKGIDDFMIESGCDYYRYVDDIRVVCESEYAARLALKKLILKLKSIGLGVNAKKTIIVEVGSPEYYEHQAPPDRKLEEIEALVKTKRVEEVRRALPKLRRYTLDLVKLGKCAAREFRFCVNRIETIARSQFSAECDFSWIVDPAIDALDSQPWAAAETIRLLESARMSSAQIERVVEFLRDTRRNIYEWQGFHIWRLMTALELSGKRQKGELRDYAHEVLNGGWERPMKAGAIHYLGSCGTGRDRVTVAKSFRRVAKSRLMSRSAVLAVQEVPRGVLDKHVRPYLTPDMSYALDYLHAERPDGFYYEPRPSLQMGDIYWALPETENS